MTTCKQPRRAKKSSLFKVPMKQQYGDEGGKNNHAIKCHKNAPYL